MLRINHCFGFGRALLPFFLSLFRPWVGQRSIKAVLLWTAAATCLAQPEQDSPAQQPAAVGAQPESAASAAERTAAPGTELTLKTAPRLPLSSPARSRQSLPMYISAGELRGRPDLDVAAKGDVQFRQGDLFLRADDVSYDIVGDLMRAQGQVRIERSGDVFTGPELQLKVNQFEGYFLSPTYYFALTQAGGNAKRVDFLSEQRFIATGATYSSCPADGSQDPAWLMSAKRVRLNFAENEGIAEGGVLRFFGVPILAAPVLSFPLTDERKSGWLPPDINVDNRSGLQLSVPYYWNMAPQRDATFTPTLITRRGFGMESEFRYLEPGYDGTARLNLLPGDRLTKTDRYALDSSHQSNPLLPTQYNLRLLRVSDDDYWKDFPRNVGSITPRLLLSEAKVTHPLGDWTTYANVMKWQVLQGTDPSLLINDTPYERAPQIGARVTQRLAGGLELAVETEVNHFINPTGTLNPSRVTGIRAHSLTSLSRPWVTPGWTLIPRVSLNAANYALDQELTSGPWQGKRHASRVIPTFSLDGQLAFEREANLFGNRLRQTLEPRLVYAYTPFKDQSGLPLFDSAPKDFNLNSLYSDNVFSGIDRVSDANQLTMGLTTKWFSPIHGGEVLSLGLAQRYLVKPQQLTANGTPSTERLSNVYLDASTNLIPRLQLSSSVQYDTEIRRAVFYSNSATFTAAPFKVLSLSYTGARNFSEQAAVGWQWPLYGPASQSERGSPLIRSSSASSSSCVGTLYGVGRVNYNMRQSRVTDSVIGFEYDAGCWIGRLVTERLSTGLSEATSRVLIQLELVGLSRLGANPLKLLKDNVPGYRLLRDRANPQTLPGPYD